MVKKKSRVKKGSKKLPLGLKIISMLAIVLSIIIILFVLYRAVEYIFSNYYPNEFMFIIFPLVFAGILAIVTSTFGVNALKRKDSGRIGLGIIFSLIFMSTFLRIAIVLIDLVNYFDATVMYELWEILLYIPILLISGFIAWYLLFNKKVRDAFKK